MAPGQPHPEDEQAPPRDACRGGVGGLVSGGLAVHARAETPVEALALVGHLAQQRGAGEAVAVSGLKLVTAAPRHRGVPRMSSHENGPPDHGCEAPAEESRPRRPSRMSMSTPSSSARTAPAPARRAGDGCTSTNSADRLQAGSARPDLSTGPAACPPRHRRRTRPWTCAPTVPRLDHAEDHLVHGVRHKASPIAALGRLCDLGAEVERGFVGQLQPGPQRHPHQLGRVLDQGRGDPLPFTMRMPSLM